MTPALREKILSIIGDLGSGYGNADEATDAILDAVRHDESTKLIKSVVDWFEYMKKDHHEKLIEGQTLHSAAENWDSLEQPPLDIEPLIDYLRAIEGK